MTEQEMMEIWQKVATPGAEHALLAKYTGTWETTMKTWMAPNTPPTEAVGTVVNTMILEGRIRREEFHAEIMTMKFNGIGELGFDNHMKKYWLTWADNFSTQLMYLEGSAAAGGKELVFHGNVNKPVQQMNGVPMKCVYRLIDDNNYSFESWEHVGTPQEFRTLEIHYKRK